MGKVQPEIWSYFQFFYLTHLSYSKSITIYEFLGPLYTLEVRKKVCSFSSQLSAS